MSNMKKSIIIWILLGILAAVLLFMPAFSQNKEKGLGLVSQLVEIKHKAENKMSRILADTTYLILTAAEASRIESEFSSVADIPKREKLINETRSKIRKERILERTKKVNEIVADYNMARTAVDQLLLQLCMDLQMKSRPGIFRRLNRFFRTNNLDTKITPSGWRRKIYKNGLQTAYMSYVIFMKIEPSGFLTKSREIAAKKSTEMSTEELTEETSKAASIGEWVGLAEIPWSVIQGISESNAKKTDSIILKFSGRFSGSHSKLSLNCN